MFTQITRLRQEISWSEFAAYCDNRISLSISLSTVAPESFSVKLQAEVLPRLNETHVSLAVHSKTPFITMRGKRDTQEVAMQHQHLHSAILELQDLGVVEVQHNMAILSLIGIGLKHSYGLAGKFFSALGNNFINIEMISQGASEVR